MIYLCTGCVCMLRMLERLHVAWNTFCSSWMPYLQRREDGNLGWQTHWVVDEQPKKDPTISYRTIAWHAMTGFHHCFQFLEKPQMGSFRILLLIIVNLGPAFGDFEGRPRQNHKKSIPQGFLDFENGSKSWDHWTIAGCSWLNLGKPSKLQAICWWCGTVPWQLQVHPRQL